MKEGNEKTMMNNEILEKMAGRRKIKDQDTIKCKKNTRKYSKSYEADQNKVPKSKMAQNLSIKRKRYFLSISTGKSNAETRGT